MLRDLHFDILPAAQRALWDDALDVPPGFVLYGGTAIALRLGHRASEDFDFFSAATFEPESLRTSLAFAGGAELLQVGANPLTVRTSAGVKVSLFGGLHFGQIAPPDPAAPRGVRIASLADLLAAKLKVVAQRAEAKEYRDIAALLDAGLTLEHGLGCGAALFGAEFNASLPLRALTYFEDGDLPSLPAEMKARLSRAAGAVREIPRTTRAADSIG